MENHYFALIRKAWKYAAGRKKQFVLTYVLFAFANLTHMLEPILLAKFLNTIQIGGEGTLKKATIILALYASLSLIFWVFHGTGRVIERTNAFHIVRTFSSKLFTMLTALPLKWHKNRHSGNLMSRVQKATDSLKRFVDEGFMYIQTFVNFFLSLAAIFFLLPISGIIAFVLGMLIMIIIFRFDRILTGYFRIINDKWHIFDATFYDYITNIRTVITLRLGSLTKRETIKKINSIFPVWKKNAVLNETKWFVISLGLSALSFLIIFMFIFQKFSTNETIMIGTLVALYQYAHRFNNVFFELAWKYEELIKYNTDLKSVQSIENAYNTFGLEKKIKGSPTNFSSIKIQNLYFKYEDEKHKKHNLKNVNIEFAKGERIAFVGESGGGKSTMMSLLRGLDAADRVNVNIDSKEFKTLKVLSDFVTLIPQDPEIFDNTIEYNISAGISHGKKEIMEACRLACFDKVMKRLPKKLKTSIKEKGVNLSGGEKQRLALARGIFAAKHSQLILLDEPTSSVDTQGELKIYKNLFEKFKDRTLISSVHRLHLLPNFDMIYIFENGKQVAHGSFEELLKTSLHFQRMWRTYKRAAR